MIADIEACRHTYYVQECTPRTEVRVVARNGRKHLQTIADATDRNNLDNLPNC